MLHCRALNLFFFLIIKTVPVLKFVTIILWLTKEILPTDLTHTTSTLRKDSLSFDKTVSTVSLHVMMKHQHPAPPIKSDWQTCREAQGPTSAFMRGGKFTAIRKQCVSFLIVLITAPELETAHWLSVHKVTTLFKLCQNTKSKWRKRMTEVTALSSQSWFPMRM